MDTRENLLLLWTAGLTAPYNLFDGQPNMDGFTPLVEGGNGKRVISAGDVIPDDVTARIKAQVYRPKGEPIEVDVLVRDEQGRPKLDGDGNAVTTKETITPEPPPYLLSLVDRIIQAEDDMHCDQCGALREELFSIGDGWYCKVERTAPSDTDEEGTPVARTCFDRRLRSMK